jgi:hypothetical protein
LYSNTHKLTIEEAVYRSRCCWLAQQWNHGSISCRVKRCFIFKSTHTGCEAQPAPLSKDKGCSPRGQCDQGVKLPSPSNAKFKNKWSYTSTLPHNLHSQWMFPPSGADTTLQNVSNYVRLEVRQLQEPKSRSWGMWHPLVWYTRTDISEELAASVVRSYTWRRSQQVRRNVATHLPSHQKTIIQVPIHFLLFSYLRYNFQLQCVFVYEEDQVKLSHTWTITVWHITALLRTAIVCTGQRAARPHTTQEESYFLHAVWVNQRATGRAASCPFPLPIITAEVPTTVPLTHSSVMVGALQWQNKRLTCALTTTFRNRSS